jgi:hypothetical protein
MPLIQTAGPGVVIEWDPYALKNFQDNAHGPFSPALRALGEIVTRGAKARAEVRTGRMRSEITYVLHSEPGGCSVEIISPAVNPADGFPYPIVHEGRHVRDRRPHRSLRPALMDVYKIAPPAG